MSTLGLVLIGTICLISILTFFRSYGSNKVAKRVLIGFANHLDHVTWHSFLLFGMTWVEGIYLGKKIKCFFNDGIAGDSQRDVTVETKIRSDKAIPWWKIIVNYPEIIPDYRLIGALVTHRTIIRGRLRDFDTHPLMQKQILDSLIVACNKVEQLSP